MAILRNIFCPLVSPPGLGAKVEQEEQNDKTYETNVQVNTLNEVYRILSEVPPPFCDATCYACRLDPVVHHRCAAFQQRGVGRGGNGGIAVMPPSTRELTLR